MENKFKLHPDLLRELTEGERTPLDLYRLVQKLPTRRGYWVLRAGVFVLVLAGSLWAGTPVTELGRQVRDVSTATFQFASTILGIVIAGFAIFTTVATSSVVQPLVSIPRKSLKTSELKYLTLHFIAAFIPYLAFIGLHALVMTFGSFGGPVTRLAGMMGSELSRWAAAGFLAFLAAYLVHLAITLQSFIFNVYKAFMTMARAKIELEQSVTSQSSVQSTTAKSDRSLDTVEDEGEEDEATPAGKNLRL